MRRASTWALVSAAAAFACAYAFVSLWATADLGYDAYPGGKRVIAVWGNAMVGFFVVTVVAAVLGIRAAMSSRRKTDPSRPPLS